MLRKRLLAITFLTLFVAAGAVSAETFVGGDLQIDVKVGDVTTEAAFLGNAETDIGTINDGSFIIGRTTITVEVENVTTSAAFLSNACTSIGSIGGCKNQSGGR